MKVTERHVRSVKQGKWDDLMKVEMKYDEIEKRLGFPPKRNYRLISGTEDFGTFVMERDWPSMAAMEANFEKVMADPEWQALGPELNACSGSTKFELYWTI